ncbi:ncdn [Linum perenne]
MVSKIPMILKIMAESSAPILEECCEILYLVSTNSDEGVSAFYESDGLKVVASTMHTVPHGSNTMELLIKMLQHILGKLPQDFMTSNRLSHLATAVESLARQFALLHSSLKFEALHLLSQIFSSKNLEPLCGTLRVMGDNNWLDYIHIGVVDILQNRVAPADKVHALILAESMLSISGEEWLVRQPQLVDRQAPLPVDRCVLLVLESARVEVAVLLNELAYLKYEASKSTVRDETIPSKQQNLTIAFSLIERIIKLISAMAEDEEVIDESTIINMINGLNETVKVVLEYLQDAKEHGEKKGNDLLASVRLLGSYLAETPNALKEKVKELLEYMLSIEALSIHYASYFQCFAK